MGRLSQRWETLRHQNLLVEGARATRLAQLQQKAGGTAEAVPFHKHQRETGEAFWLPPVAPNEWG